MNTAPCKLLCLYEVEYQNCSQEPDNHPSKSGRDLVSSALHFHSVAHAVVSGSLTLGSQVREDCCCRVSVPEENIVQPLWHRLWWSMTRGQGKMHG